MNAPRAAAWALLVASVAVSSFDSAVAPSTGNLTSSGYRILDADFHVHAFLGDGALPPWEIAREASRRGLDAVAVTNHNQMYALRLHRALFRQPLRSILIPGVEVTNPDYHLAAIGIAAPIDWRLPLAEAIRAVHAQGGVAIAAHPVGRFWARADSETLALLDGLEVAHPLRRIAEERADVDALHARIRQIKPTIAAIGSSDYHFGAPMGGWRTRLLVREPSVAGVLEAIRAGRTAAYDPEGRVFGQPEWVAAAAGAPAVDARAADTVRHHAAMLGAWLALLFLVVFTGKR
jgi:hypothetical protein